MRRKDKTVECEFHPVLTEFLVEVDELYREWNDELVITSGSEQGTRHKLTSFHYATPGQAADSRTWDAVEHNRGTVPPPNIQHAAIEEKAIRFCLRKDIPANWIEVILEAFHIHIEYQPKRRN